MSPFQNRPTRLTVAAKAVWEDKGTKFVQSLMDTHGVGGALKVSASKSPGRSPYLFANIVRPTGDLPNLVALKRSLEATGASCAMLYTIENDRGSLVSPIFWPIEDSSDLRGT